VDRAEAEAIYDAGREVVVEVLLRMDRRIQQLEERVEKLERELARNSRNSSAPPSSDPPGSAPARRSKGSSGRGQGAQPGHEGKGRELLPVSAVDEVICHWPGRCDCGQVFAEAELVAAREPARHQVEELPRLAVRVIEHQRMRARCPECGVEQTGQLPAEVAASAFGPRLQAAVTTLTVRNRVSRRDTVELCEELFGARICSGSVDAILARAGEALERPYDDLARRLRRSSHINMDETGWRLKGSRRTLWGAFTDKVAVYRIAPDRHERHARELLVGHQGTVTSDRWWAYGHLPTGRRQICWAHLRRDFQAHAEGLAAEKEFGERGLSVCEQLFWAWEIYQHTGERRELKRRAARCAASSSRSCAPTRAARRATSTRAGWHATCSKPGPRCGPSPTAAASSRPTTTPSARSGARSSTASSHSAASPRPANAASSGCSQPRPPAASSTARSSTTSPTSSPPTPAATQSPCSPEPTD